MASVFLFILPHTSAADETYKKKPKKISSRGDRQFLAELGIVFVCLLLLWTGRWYLHFTVFIKKTLENKPNGAVSDHKIINQMNDNNYQLLIQATLKKPVV